MAGIATTPFSVQGKRALITGAGSGVNFCFASLLLSRGCSVLIADLALRPEAQKLVEQYSSATSSLPRAIFQETDVTDWKQLERALDVCIREFGGVDIVGPGAGVFEPPWSNFWQPPGSQGSKDSVDGNSYKTLDINVNHPIRLTQLAISAFLNPKDAKDKVSLSNPKRIVLTSSIAGQATGLPTPLYFASKHAINGFTRSLGGLDESLGIRVNAVAPGVVRTPLWTDHPEKLEWFNEEADVWIAPEEVAGQMLRLLEDEGLPGGTVLEVAAHGTSRMVTAFNDPGPQGEGHRVSKAADAVTEVYKLLGQDGWGKTK